ncbi:MAG: hypothetical protein P8P74_05980 [Crocinitomicaceae bacterium]|nr:hypothetical protein [Crocinitomicaceae bacterium]
MSKINPKHVLLPSIVFSIVFFLMYFRLKGVSGGDILIGAISAVILVGMALIIGLSTYSWKFKNKLGYIIGIALSFLLMFIYKLLLL